MRSYACLFVLSLSMVSSLSAAALKAGAAVMDITPKEFPMNMPGGFSANTATEAHDPLNARALVLDDGKTKVVWMLTCATQTAPTAAELLAGVDLETFITPDGLIMEGGRRWRASRRRGWASRCAG